MHSVSRVTFSRYVILASALAAAGLVACSDSSTGLRSAAGVSASADKGGGKGKQNDKQNENQNENQNGNQNNENQDTARVELRIRLVRPVTAPPDSNAEGQAKFESRGARMKLQIEAENLTPGDTVNFFVNGVQIGSRVVGNSGEAELELDSQHGQTVPAVAVGTTVAVETNGGVTIVSGTF